VLCEDTARELFNFAERDCFKAACSFKAKAKPSDAREKIKDAQLAHFCPRLMQRPIHIASGIVTAK